MKWIRYTENKNVGYINSTAVVKLYANICTDQYIVEVTLSNGEKVTLFNNLTLQCAEEEMEKIMKTIDKELKT